jgi:hypothetical protein
MAASLDMATRVAEQAQVIENLRSDVAAATTIIAERNATVTQRDATIAQRDATIAQLHMSATQQDSLSMQARSDAATAEGAEKEAAEKKNAERLAAARPTKRKFEKSRIGPELSAAMCGLDMVTRVHEERSPYAAARAALRAEAYHQVRVTAQHEALYADRGASAGHRAAGAVQPARPRDRSCLRSGPQARRRQVASEAQADSWR